MSINNKYNIKDTDRFNPANYPGVVAELNTMNKELVETSIYYKEDIIISYLKDHRIRRDWIHANEKLVEMIISGSFPISNIELLFESSRANKTFTQDLESYIKKSYTR